MNKEEFLKLKDYEEYNKKRIAGETKGLDWTDKELWEHLVELMTFEDVAPAPRDVHVDYFRKWKEEDNG